MKGLVTKESKGKFGYSVGKATDLADPGLWARAQEYRRRMSGSMRLISPQEVSRVAKARGFYATRKYNGEFAMVVFDGKDIISVNPGGTTRYGLPCLDEAAKLLIKAKVKSCIFAAEYYMLDESSKANLVQQVVGTLRSPKKKEQLDEIGLAVFDVIEADGKSELSANNVFDLLSKWFGKGKKVHVVEHHVTDDIDKVLKLFNEWVVEGNAEGIVLRHDNVGIYKIKTRHDLDVAVIGFSEGSDDRKGMLHDLLVAVVRDDGTFQELTRVGGGFSDDERRELVKKFKKRVAPSEYVAVNNDFVAYEMIEPGPVIEISCLDMIEERVRGGPVNRMVLEWDGKRYSALRRMPLVSVISPQFIRLRDDKEAGKDDTGIRQIAERTAVEDVDSPARADEKPPSKIIERSVYTKTMKENLMVRKLLLWNTNKEEDPEFPAYVVYLTDFSPNRAKPLVRDIKIAGSERSAKKMFDEFAAKNFIGGWEKVD